MTRLVHISSWPYRLPPAAPLVLTDALVDNERDRDTFDDYRVIAKRKPAELLSIALDCDPEENERRLVSTGRQELLKLTRREILQNFRAKHQLLEPHDFPCFRLDVSHVAADDVAETLAGWVREVCETPRCGELASCCAVAS
jgi:hypothetical protein